MAVFGQQTSGLDGIAMVCIRCGSAEHTTQQHDNRSDARGAGGGAQRATSPPMSPRRARSNRMRNVKTDAQRKRLQAAIKAADTARPVKGPFSDEKITPYRRDVAGQPNRCATTFSGARAPTKEERNGSAERREQQPPQAIVRRFDGGRRLPVLTAAWAGAPPQVVNRGPSVKDSPGGAEVPALLRNGEIVDFEDDWSSQREYAYIRTRREGGKEETNGWVERCHLKPFDLTTHGDEWDGRVCERPGYEYKEWPLDKEFEEKEWIMKTRRQLSLIDADPKHRIGNPRRELRWTLSDKSYTCPMQLCSARDVGESAVSATPAIYKESHSAADRISGFAPKAAPKHVILCAR